MLHTEIVDILSLVSCWAPPPSRGLAECKESEDTERLYSHQRDGGYVGGGSS